MRAATHHLTRVAAALAVTVVLVGPSAHATTTEPAALSSHAGHRTYTPVPGHDSSEWLMMGLHCGASLS